MTEKVQRINEKHFGAVAASAGRRGKTLCVILPCRLNEALRLEAKTRKVTISKLVRDYLAKGLK